MSTVLTINNVLFVVFKSLSQWVISVCLLVLIKINVLFVKLLYRPECDWGQAINLFFYLVCIQLHYLWFSLCLMLQMQEEWIWHMMLTFIVAWISLSTTWIFLICLCTNVVISYKFVQTENHSLNQVLQKNQRITLLQLDILTVPLLSSDLIICNVAIFIKWGFLYIWRKRRNQLKLTD